MKFSVTLQQDNIKKSRTKLLLKDIVMCNLFVYRYGAQQQSRIKYVSPIKGDSSRLQVINLKLSSVFTVNKLYTCNRFKR